MASTKLAVGTTTDLWRDSSATAAHKSRGRWSGCLFMAALLGTLGIMLAAHRQMLDDYALQSERWTYDAPAATTIAGPCHNLSRYRQLHWLAGYICKTADDITRATG